MPRMSAADRREALARAALAVVVRDGVNAATTRAITAEAGMPLASFHYAVASREELLRDVVELVVAGEGAAMLESPGLDAPDLRSAVREVLGSYLELVKTHPGREQAMFELTQHALRSPGMSDLPAQQYGAYRALATEVLDQGAAKFGVRWSIPTEELAAFSNALTDGATLAWLATRDDAAAERILDLAADAIAAHALPLDPAPLEEK